MRRIIVLFAALLYALPAHAQPAARVYLPSVAVAPPSLSVAGLLWPSETDAPPRVVHEDVCARMPPRNAAPILDAMEEWAPRLAADMGRLSDLRACRANAPAADLCIVGRAGEAWLGVCALTVET